MELELTYSFGNAQASFAQKVNLALTKKVLDTAELKGDQMVEMLKTSQAPHPTLGMSIDLKG
ncbi:YjfB family protein [Domibacillus epiphyticus]|uniref:Motility protein n=1 Tax=Domibacillus epiphyticus TaxID=1714355 RepID=A0A1V2A569_9BACI|nr:YjfB family protein [Domibacillus epiphyticus]OMP66161.1 hypothetical protein BTO28_13650 [Domibacillus epiphyticus]